MRTHADGIRFRSTFPRSGAALLVATLSAFVLSACGGGGGGNDGPSPTITIQTPTGAPAFSTTIVQIGLGGVVSKAREIQVVNRRTGATGTGTIMCRFAVCVWSGEAFLEVGVNVIEVTALADSTASGTATATIAITRAALPASAEGLWFGSIGGNRSLHGLVLEDQTYWLLYTQAGHTGTGPSVPIGGLLQGNLATAQGGTFNSSNGINFNVQGFGISGSTLNGSFVYQQSLTGTADDPILNQSTFTSRHVGSLNPSPTLSSLAGTYTGYGYTTTGADATTVTITPGGAINGIAVSGCSFSGSAAPHAHGAAFDISITFAGGACANGTDTVNGVADFDDFAKIVNIATLNGGRTNGFIYVGH